jgi:hypothetical protein
VPTVFFLLDVCGTYNESPLRGCHRRSTDVGYNSNANLDVGKLVQQQQTEKRVFFRTKKFFLAIFFDTPKNLKPYLHWQSPADQNAHDRDMHYTCTGFHRQCNK